MIATGAQHLQTTTAQYLWRVDALGVAEQEDPKSLQKFSGAHQRQRTRCSSREPVSALAALCGFWGGRWVRQ